MLRDINSRVLRANREFMEPFGFGFKETLGPNITRVDCHPSLAIISSAPKTDHAWPQNVEGECENPQMTLDSRRLTVVVR